MSYFFPSLAILTSNNDFFSLLKAYLQFLKNVFVFETTDLQKTSLFFFFFFTKFRLLQNFHTNELFFFILAILMSINGDFISL